MNNSRKIEILELLILELQDPMVKSTSKNGICLALRGVHRKRYITHQEYLDFVLFLDTLKPDKKQYVMFTKLPTWKGSRYWWSAIYLDITALQVRVDFLNAVIDNLKSIESCIQK